MNRPPQQRDTATVPLPDTALRVVLFGIECRFTEVVLQRLLERDIVVATTVLPGPPVAMATQRVAPPRIHLHVADDTGSASSSALRRTPVVRIGSLSDAATFRYIATLNPDIILVACFPYRIPGDIRDLARIAALNIHPSALPANRGPDPLFWAFKRGDGRFGVTLHALSERLDSGDIVEARTFADLHGVPESSVEHDLAVEGADMAADFVARPVTMLRGMTPQNESLASYEGWPSREDYRIDPSRPAQAAFNFIRGVKERDIPIRAAVSGRDVRITDAIAVEPDGSNRAEPLIAGNVIRLPCNPGSLVATIACT